MLGGAGKGKLKLIHHPCAGCSCWDVSFCFLTLPSQGEPGCFRQVMVFSLWDTPGNQERGVMLLFQGKEDRADFCIRELACCG